MDKLLEERLYECIVLENHESILSLIQQGANPNKITSHGKTCLGEAAYLGNISIIHQLIDACKSNYPQNRNFTQSYSKKRHVKTHKRKLRSSSQHDDTVIKCKNLHDRALKCNPVSESTPVPQDYQRCEKNQGYFVFIHSEGSSSDESKMCSLKSPVSPSSQVSSPQAELEWDEETANVAPTTSEDETWSSMYKWYAAILECTGAAIASASIVTNGIDQQDAFMRTALHYAVEQGHTQIVKLIIDAGCKVDIAAGDGLTSLHIAVMKNHAEIVRQLISAGSHVNYKTHEKMTPLHFAASRGFLELVKILVNNGAYLEARDTSERTALYLAAGRGHVDVVRYLILVGANVNGEEIHEIIALFWLDVGNRLSFTTWASPTRTWPLRYKNTIFPGYTPLCEAVWQRYTKVVEVLLLSGARITHSHKLLHNAIIQRQEEIVRLLANMGGGINLHNDNGDTPLLLAARLSQPTIAQILLQKGGNINSCNNITGASALHIAVESIDSPKEFEELLVCFLKYKIDMNSTALTGDTALNRALLLQKDHAAVLLIRYGADVNACDLNSCGLDNLSIASRRRSTHLANLLLKSGHHRPLPDSYSTSKCSTSLWIQDVCKQPQTLLDICRIRIRSICKKKPLFCYVNSLPLPKSLKRFLMLEDEGMYDV